MTGDNIGRGFELKYSHMNENHSNSRTSQLTKIFRSHNSTQTQPTVPSYGLRDLSSVVKYHKEMGIAPILSSKHKYILQIGLRLNSSLLTIIFNLIIIGIDSQSKVQRVVN